MLLFFIVGCGVVGTPSLLLATAAVAFQHLIFICSCGSGDGPDHHGAPRRGIALLLLAVLSSWAVASSPLCVLVEVSELYGKRDERMCQLPSTFTSVGAKGDHLRRFMKLFHANGAARRRAAALEEVGMMMAVLLLCPKERVADVVVVEAVISAFCDGVVESGESEGIT